MGCFGEGVEVACCLGLPMWAVHGKTGDDKNDLFVRSDLVDPRMAPKVLARCTLQAQCV